MNDVKHDLMIMGDVDDDDADEIDLVFDKFKYKSVCFDHFDVFRIE